ncbi:hypothetical protein [Marinomonas fungiae]|uniref:hypothetical protein n=1 Tax=Marinomonas fungiae TaxID=1137284 RepID=UPI003A8D42D2
MTDTLTQSFPKAPLEAIPTSKHKGSNITLKVLSDGKEHHRDELTQLLGETWRSALQSLRGDRFGYWLIHSIKAENSKTTLLQIDPRHLSGCPKQDAAARLERRKQLKNVSYKEAQQGWKRMPKAHTAMLEADKAYFKSLGEAANDSEQGE